MQRAEVRMSVPYSHSDQIKDTLNIQVKNFGAGGIGSLLKWTTPCCSCIGHENIEVVIYCPHASNNLPNSANI